MKDLTLLVMAAGMGSRYGGLKQLDEIGPNGETIIDYSVYDAIEAGFNKVVFIIRQDFKDLFKEKISDKYTDKIIIQKIKVDLPWPHFSWIKLCQTLEQYQGAFARSIKISW